MSETESVAVVEHFDALSATGKWSALYSQLDGTTYRFRIRWERVLELIPKKLGDVLDVGCGPGVMVDAVLERGGTFTGVDLSPEMIKRSGGTFRRSSRLQVPGG